MSQQQVKTRRVENTKKKNTKQVGVKVLYSHLSVLINPLWSQRIQGGAEVLVVAAGMVQTGSQQQR